MYFTCVLVWAINMPLAPAFQGGVVSPSSFVAIGPYIESLDEVSIGRIMAHGIFKVLALKIKYSIDKQLVS